MLDKMLVWLHGLPPDFVVAVISSAPVVELRGGIPAGVFLLKLPLWRVFIVAVIANILCVTPILLGFEWVTGHLQDKPLVGPILRWALEHAEKKKAFVGQARDVGADAVVRAVPIPGLRGVERSAGGTAGGAVASGECFAASGDRDDRWRG